MGYLNIQKAFSTLYKQIEAIFLGIFWGQRQWNAKLKGDQTGLDLEENEVLDHPTLSSPEAVIVRQTSTYNLNRFGDHFEPWNSRPGTPIYISYDIGRELTLPTSTRLPRTCKSSTRLTRVSRTDFGTSLSPSHHFRSSVAIKSLDQRASMGAYSDLDAFTVCESGDEDVAIGEISFRGPITSYLPHTSSQARFTTHFQHLNSEPEGVPSD